jgi:hypothetical protein
MLTSVSLRLALKRLAEIRCGTAPSSIRVAVVPCGTDRTYVVSIPFEYRTEVYQFLVDSTDVSPPLDGGPLILTPDQASTIVHLAYRAERNPSPLNYFCAQNGGEGEGALRQEHTSSRRRRALSSGD